MFKATVNRKEKVDGSLRIYVDFTDGDTVITESCIPQNEDGFTHWVKSRLEVFNVAKVLDTSLSENAEIVIDKTAVPEEAPTAEELWLRDYNKWLRVKLLIDAGIVPSTNAAVQALLNKVKAGFKAEYINLL